MRLWPVLLAAVLAAGPVIRPAPAIAASDGRKLTISNPAPYRAPTPNGVCLEGDSRFDYLTGGPVYASAAYSLKVAQSFDYQGVLGYMATSVPYPDSFGRAVSGSTTQGMVGRQSSTSVAATGNPAFAITSVAGDNPYNSNSTGANFTWTVSSGVGTISAISVGNNGGGVGVGNVIKDGSGNSWTISSLGTSTGGNGTVNVTGSGNVGSESAWLGLTNAMAGGPYSVANDPACNDVLILASINDVTNGVPTTVPGSSMTNIASMLDTLKKKHVFLTDEVGRGVGYTNQGEQHAIPGSPFQVTVTNASGFIVDTLGSMPGVVCTNGTGTNLYLTKVASGPASGQYSVSAGVYTFNTAQSGLTCDWFYTYAGGTDFTGAKLTQSQDIHFWLISNAANYIGACSGTNFAIPGALYHRPWVTPVLTWEASGAGNGCTTGSVRNTAGYLTDGTHPIALGVLNIGNVMAAALRTRYGSAPLLAPPLWNNAWVLTANGSTSSFSGTLPGLMASSQIAAYHAAFPTGGIQNQTAFQVCALNACGYDADGSGNLTGNGITAAGGHVTGGTINFSTGAFTLTFNANITNGTKIKAYIDPANWLSNGQGDTTNSAVQGNGTITTTTGSTCVNASIPGHWTVGLTASLVTNINAGSLILTCGSGTAPDGNYGFWFKLVGQVPSGNQTINITQLIDNPATFFQSASAPVDKARGYVKITVAAGPGGHLLGVSQIPQQRLASATTTGSVNGESCIATQCGQLNGYVGQGLTNSGFTDTDLVQDGNTAREFPLQTPLVPTATDVVPATLTLEEVIPTVFFVPSTIVDATIWFQNMAIKTETR